MIDSNSGSDLSTYLHIARDPKRLAQLIRMTPSLTQQALIDIALVAPDELPKILPGAEDPKYKGLYRKDFFLEQVVPTRGLESEVDDVPMTLLLIGANGLETIARYQNLGYPVVNNINSALVTEILRGFRYKEIRKNIGFHDPERRKSSRRSTDKLDAIAYIPGEKEFVVDPARDRFAVLLYNADMQLAEILVTERIFGRVSEINQKIGIPFTVTCAAVPYSRTTSPEELVRMTNRSFNRIFTDNAGENRFVPYNAVHDK